MNQLTLVWWMSLTLAVLALSTLSVLIVRRARDEHRLAHDQSVRLILQEILFRFMVADPSRRETDLNNLLNFRRREASVLRKLAIDLFHLIKGSERDKLRNVLQLIGLRDDCLRDLEHGGIRERRLAAEALHIFKDAEVQAALLKALDDADAETQVLAADSLLLIDALPDIHYLMGKLVPAIRMQSRDVRTLFRDIARYYPARILARIERGGLSRVEKVLLAEAMAYSSDYCVLPSLQKWAEDSDVELRATAMRALSGMQHPAVLPQIRAGLWDMQWQVRAVAARAAGRIGLTECISDLNFLIDDRNWWVRYRAAEALYKLGQAGIEVLQLRATYAGCGGFGRGARMAALVLDELGISTLSEVIYLPAVGEHHA